MTQESAEAAISISVEIVTFRPDLASHFARINRYWLEEFFHVEPIDEQILSDPQGRIIDRGGQILFAIDGDAVVGTCALKPRGPGEFELTKMGVDPGVRGGGVGQQLLQAAIATFQAIGGESLMLETHSSLKAAIHIYETHGFVRAREAPVNSDYARSDVLMHWQGHSGSVSTRRK